MTTTLPLGTFAIIGLTCAVSFVAFRRAWLMQRLWFSVPAIQRGQYERFVTHGLVHADAPHLLLNMVTLFFFGAVMEPFFASHIGITGYLAFYGSAVAAAIFPSYIAHRHDPAYRSLGASGAVSAVLFAYVLVDPWSLLYVLVIPVPAIVFAVSYLLYGVVAARRAGSRINHSAHVWGAVYGMTFSLIMAPGLGIHFVREMGRPLG
jgi:membrane associated rhomboid family serine protease